MNARKPTRWFVLFAACSVVSGLPLLLAGCDRETATSKSSSTKIVDTPEGKKKVTESTETTTTKEKKDNP